MTNTPIYGKPHITSNPVSGEVPANDEFDTIENAANAVKTWTVTADFTAGQTDMAAGFIHLLSGSPAADFHFNLPAVARIFAVKNSTGKTATVQVTGAPGTTYNVYNGKEVLLKSDGTNVALFAVVPSSVEGASGVSSAPTGNISTTQTAMGLGLVTGFAITPKTTGRVAIFIGGMVFNSTAAGDGVTIQGRYGTGTAPSNGATSGLGTAFGQSQRFVASTTAGKQGFICMGIVTGLALGTAIWFDLSIIAVIGGGASVQDVNIVVMEL